MSSATNKAHRYETQIFVFVFNSHFCINILECYWLKYLGSTLGVPVVHWFVKFI